MWFPAVEMIPMDDRQRAKTILAQLKHAHTDAPSTYLDSHNPFEMTIATILSAHTTDRCVNSVTPRLFKRYPDAASLAGAQLNDIIEIIRPCGTYNRKAEFIHRTASELVERFSGKVPSTMADLVTLPGISRKTANVVLSVAYGVNEGVVVDTHIMRVTQRLFLSKQKTPQKVETDLMTLLPHESWGDYARLVGAHGRRVCFARAPKCASCVVNSLCPSAGKV